MPLNATYPSSVDAGAFITLGWSNTFNDDYFTVSRQINSRLTWQGTLFPIGSNLTRYSEIAEETWSNVRYRIVGVPSGAEVITNWITVVGGSGPGDPDPGEPNPDPPLSVPVILVPESATPGVSFQINWSDTNGTTAEYDIEESVNRGDYQRIASSWPNKSYSRIASSTWDVVQYRIRAIRNLETTAWAYSADITVGAIFPKMAVKVGSEVRNAVDGWVMVNGQLRKITDVWVMVDGQLKKS